MSRRQRSLVFTILAATLVLFSGQAEGGPAATSTGLASGEVTTTRGDTDCDQILFNADASYENGFAWQYEGVTGTDFGAFAECYQSDGILCGLAFDFSQTGSFDGQSMDLYVWESGFEPGAVVCLLPGVVPGNIAMWPSLSRHLVDLPDCSVGSGFWAGYRGNWPNEIAAWFVGADLDGFGGCPKTRIAPGIGYPTGWNSVSIVWGPTQAVGIGVVFREATEEIGACCLALGVCEILPPENCSTLGGQFEGLGTNCDPNPCSQPCVPFALAGRQSATQPPPPIDPFEAAARSEGTGGSGPHRGGVLVLHADPGVVYTGDSYCRYPGIDGCDALVARWDSEETAVVHVLALFSDEATPALTGATFGIDFPDCVELVDWQACGDFELAEGEWPSPRTGTAITWATPQVETATQVYWFGARGLEAEPGELALTVHPTQGAWFADDSTPPILDPIQALGSFGFFRDGIAPCPSAPNTGACCLPDGGCVFLDFLECDAANGTFKGIGVLCSPDPCGALGACCFPGGTCLHLERTACTNGDFIGEGTVCDPNPCPGTTLGACCFPGGSCRIATGEGCEGDFLGVGTVCDPNPCDTTIGACCFPDGSCQVLTGLECVEASGDHLGPDTECEPNPCPHPPTGACCFGTGDCSLLTITECAIAEGSFLGNDTVCEPNPCPTPLFGACCLSLGGCEFSSGLECSGWGGVFLGVDTVCDPNPCPEPCVPFALAGRESSTLPAPALNPFDDPGARGSEAGFGSNRGGVLIFHTNPNVVYSSDGTYCNTIGNVLCDDITSRTDAEAPSVIHLIALFSGPVPPRLAGTVFGIDFPDCVELVDWQSCGDFELPTNGWPGPGTGTAVTWGEAQTEFAIEVYWFAAAGLPAEPGELVIIGHPTQGAFFADDSIPSILDPVVALGSFGFFRDGISPCPVSIPAGACCFDDGSCALLTVDGCAAAGGTLLGIDIPCFPDPCPPPTGACCIPADGACLDVSRAACELVGGEFLGEGTPCSPNPCDEQIVGACCFPTGECLIAGFPDCSDAGGSYLAGYDSCDPDPCPPSGACCVNDVGDCVPLFEDYCDSIGGTFLGDEVDCGSDPCPSSGACCFDEGECQILTSEACASAGGTLFEEGVPCVPNPCPQPPMGACCFTDGTCQLLTETACDTAGGTYTGEGTLCVPNPCPQPSLGACCFADGTCSFVSEIECENLEGLFLGDDLPCDPNPCDQPAEGACCLLGDACTLANEFTCGEGTFLGEGTTCEPNPCAAPGFGACCYPDGGCSIRTEVLCDGIFLGPDSACEPNPCPPVAEGACCFVSGDCLFLSAFDCASQVGTFLGDGASCEPDPCPDPERGACCAEDGGCIVASADECAATNGVFQGDSTNCDPNPCPIPIEGACCLPLGSCELSNDLVCGAADGEFQGSGSLCAPNPCPEPCVPFALDGRPSATRPAPSYDPFAYIGVGAFGSGTGGSGAAFPSVLGNGPNRGGTLVLHTEPGVVYSDDGGYCGDTSVLDCDDITSRTDAPEPLVVHLLALFHRDASPRLIGTTFGVDFPDCVQVLDWEACGDFEIAGTGWPGPGTGTAVTWAEAQTAHAIEVYWFAAVGIESEPGELAIREHPTQDALFADDSVPANLDPIEELGSFGFFRSGSTPCPAEQTPIGACCLDGPGCQVYTYANCIETGGTFYGVGTTCDPDPCSGAALGACCLPSDGSCEITNAAGCEVVGGDFQGPDTSCEPGRCTEPDLGACCGSDGSCTVTQRVDCEENSWVFRGSGTVCEPDECPPAGACCFDNGLCVFVFQFECVPAGGAFLGDGVECDTDLCPHPGACCLETGDCDILYEEQCAASGGDFQGEETSCQPNPCPQPQPGACCFEDGTCAFVDRFACADLGGEFSGEDLPCEPNPCPQPPDGACCFREGNCVFVSSYGCADLGGDYLGDGVPCDPNPCPQPGIGACCFADYECDVIFDFACDEANGRFFGDGTFCEDVSCGVPCDPPFVEYDPGEPTRGPNAGGAFILHANLTVEYTTTGPDYCGTLDVSRCEDVVTRFDPPFERVLVHVLGAFPAEASPRVAGAAFGLSYSDCFVLETWGSCADFEISTAAWPSSGEGTAVTWTSAETTRFLEIYWVGGYVDSYDATSLALAPHPTEGAVFADDSVPSNLDPASGLGQLGFRMAGVAHCPGPQVPGACCDIHGDCTIRTLDDCEDEGGLFQGAGSTCVPNPCPQPTGACCYPNGSCVLTSIEFCDLTHGDHLGDGSVCDPNPCPTPTVCCVDEQCFAIYADCEEQGGILVPGEACEPSPCPVTGACCFEDLSCQVLLEGECLAGEGGFLGFGVSCEPNPCALVPTVEESWGRLKERFRKR